MTNQSEFSLQTIQKRSVPFTAVQSSAFHRDGAVLLKSVFDVDAIEGLQHAVLDAAAAGSEHQKVFTQPGDLGRYVSDVWVSERSVTFRDFCRNATVASIPCFFLDSSSARFLYDSWIIKHPGTFDRTPWHQDWGIAGPVVSLWVPLDPVPRTASVQVVRGSHRWNRQFYEPWREAEFADMRRKLGPKLRNPNGSMPEPMPDIDRDRDRYEILSWSMEPTDCLVLNPMAIHGAPGNPTEVTMRRYTCRWSTPNARLSPSGTAYYATLGKTGHIDTVLEDGTAMLSDEGCPVITPAV